MKLEHAPREHEIVAIPPEEWDEIVSTFHAHTVFHLSPWLQAISAAYGLEPHLGGVREGNAWLAVFPVLRMRKGLWRIHGSPLPGWSTPYLGPLFNHELTSPERLSLLDGLMKHPSYRRCSYFACKVMHDGSSLDLGDLGFTQTHEYDTFRLDLNESIDDLWANLRRECRNHVRKAQKQNVDIRCECTSDFIDDYWQMTLETFARAGARPTHNRQLIEQMWQHLFPQNQMTALSAFIDDNRAATILVLNDRNVSYYWGGASYLRFRHIPTNNLLQWEGITHAKHRGAHTYDFISTTGGPGKFKESFGPQRVSIASHWERSSSRFVHLLKSKYEAFARRRQQGISSVQTATPARVHA